MAVHKCECVSTRVQCSRASESFVTFYGKLAYSMHVPLQPAFTNGYDRQEMVSSARARGWRKGLGLGFQFSGDGRTSALHACQAKVKGTGCHSGLAPLFQTALDLHSFMAS